MTKDNFRLGKFYLTGIPPALRGVPQIDVEFEMNANGLLNVSAQDKSTGNSQNITILSDKSKEEIDRMVSDAEKYKEEIEKQKQRLTARNQLEHFIFSVKQACEESLSWLDNNSLAEKEEYEDKMKELHKVCTPFVTKLHDNDQNGTSISD
ncbi:heat shock 70 kDa protein-like [Mytilus californianus]|uniref:heat shock 70 kDa protein-like n=1 Tax=Mytilus californianus TaxID=6549 RepID=UPI0022467390|nr:heat shock 70 kDa protein-like [Mytilus californianus]